MGVVSTQAAVFAGHGSPMNAIEDNEFTRGLREVAGQLRKPRSILCISAHWETDGVSVTASERPPTIHDFYGFPKELFEVQYPAPGDPALARRVAGLLNARLDPERGFDHGCWGVLRLMYPAAEIPVVQLSLDQRLTPAGHYELAKKLGPLRDEDVMIVASGNIVHNLRAVDFRNSGGSDWAVQFNEEVKRHIASRDPAALLNIQPSPAVPSPEHYLPLLYVLGIEREDDEISFFNDKVVMGAISMTSVLLSPPN